MAAQPRVRDAVGVEETTPFGRALRHWRRVRGVSQLDLAGLAATTTRHVSFLETGRSRPSATMVERLSKALAVPLRERNRLLELAGLAPIYLQGDLDSADLTAFRRVLDRLLATHEPYPAFVIDRQWRIVAHNRAASLFVADGPANTVQLLLEQWRPLIENWDEVAVALLHRIAVDLMRFPDDAMLRDLHSAVAAEVGPVPPERPSDRVVCPRFRIDDTVVRTVTVVARFESPADVTLDELRVELIFPEDKASDRFFRTRAASEP